jgi:hypothetical protein
MNSSDLTIPDPPARKRTSVRLQDICDKLEKLQENPIFTIIGQQTKSELLAIERDLSAEIAHQQHLEKIAPDYSFRLEPRNEPHTEAYLWRRATKWLTCIVIFTLVGIIGLTFTMLIASTLYNVLWS